MLFTINQSLFVVVRKRKPKADSRGKASSLLDQQAGQPEEMREMNQQFNGEMIRTSQSSTPSISGNERWLTVLTGGSGEAGGKMKKRLTKFSFTLDFVTQYQQI